MKALCLAALSIKAGYRQRTLVGGVENMSQVSRIPIEKKQTPLQVPFYVPRSEPPYGGFQAIDGIVKDGLQDAMLNQAMGTCAEKSVKDYKISREAQDEFAVNSYKKAAAAWKVRDLFLQDESPFPIQITFFYFGESSRP